MARTESKMVALGTKAPGFSLPDTVTGKITTLEEIASDVATVIMFLCNHCPFVKHIQQGFVDLTNEYKAKGISFVGISSNDVENHPEDSPELMKKEAEEWGYSFPYLYDETQQVARAYDAACTPDFYIYDKDLKLVYRGQMDDARPSLDIPVTGNDMRAALNSILDGKPVNPDQKPSIGCNIKWKI